MAIARLFALARLAAAQRLHRSTVQRVPEPRTLMDDAEQIEGYDAAGETTLGLVYCLSAEVIHLALRSGARPALLDLACGTGRFTARLAAALRPRSIRAVDLSPEMIRVARSNLERVRFAGEVQLEIGDITKLDHIGDDSFDLVTCSFTAHHLPSADPAVGRLLREMDRIARPDGVVFLLDLGRLKTRKLMEQYVRIFSAGQSDRHNEDFLNSILAAFTPAEMRVVVPPDTRHGRWLHFTGPALPTLQVVMRIPRTRELSGDPLWHESPTPLAGNAEWRWLRNQFRKRCLKASRAGLRENVQLKGQVGRRV